MTTLIARLGRWILVGVICALALIGALQLTRGTAVREVRGIGLDGIPIAVDEPQFPLNVTLLTGAWLAQDIRCRRRVDHDRLDEFRQSLAGIER